jgi:hypothetical protein
VRLGFRALRIGAAGIGVEFSSISHVGSCWTAVGTLTGS